MNAESRNHVSVAKFRWLHFSDIHVGVAGQRNLWPRFGVLLLDDLRKTLARIGTVDFVLFSGDLAQAGKKDEFDRFGEIMDEILDTIAERQDRPKIITIPGNHDLARPDPLSSGALALKQYWSNEKLRDAMWTNKGKEHTNFLNKTFRDYLTWRSSSIASGQHLTPHIEGFCPAMRAMS